MNHERTAVLENLMEEAVNPLNWEAALRAVERNNGAAGPDGMAASELRGHLVTHGGVIAQRLLEGSCQPGAARRRDIPKASGGTRPLSIPNVQDRFVQHLLLGVLQPVFEPRFSESSHGFRPGRSAHHAVKAAQKFAKEGYTHVVDMDITKFFDRVNHDILMHKLGSAVRDKRVLRIVGRFLRAGVVMPEGVVVRTEEGTPQGGPLSPLLANIYLDALDKELEKRGLRFARYADDCNIHVKSQAAAERVLESLTGWIARHLRLEVSASKSGTGRPWERKFDSGAHRAFTPSGLPVGSLCRSAPFSGLSLPPPCSSPLHPPALPVFRTGSGSSGTPGNRSRPWNCAISGAAI